jgi:hypothetical protein
MVNVGITGIMYSHMIRAIAPVMWLSFLQARWIANANAIYLTHKNTKQKIKNTTIGLSPLAYYVHILCDTNS